MKLFSKIVHPVMALIAIQLVWITMVVLWVYWFIGKHREFSELASKYRPELLGRGINWVVMVEGLLLLAILLAGVYVIFVFWNRQSTLYKHQRSIISQVTHELKSPLASIQLHLETIRLRNLDRDKINYFIDTMLQDTERLNHLISNLLMAARLEGRKRPAERQQVDISSLVLEQVEKMRKNLPDGASLHLDAEPDLKSSADPEEIGMVVRNLLENAYIYSPGAIDIYVTVEKSGSRIRISVQDHGRGIERKELAKVFDMFYRVRSSGDTVRGTGLGLHIVKSIIEDCGGSVVAESSGPGQGSTFTVLLPIAQAEQ